MKDRGSFRDAERQLVQVASSVLDEFRTRLAAAGLRFKGPEVDVCVPDLEQYSSELRIAFYRDGDVDDVFEFFLLRDGDSVVTAHDVEGWLTEQLEAMLAQ